MALPSSSSAVVGVHINMYTCVRGKACAMPNAAVELRVTTADAQEAMSHGHTCTAELSTAAFAALTKRCTLNSIQP